MCCRHSEGASAATHLRWARRKLARLFPAAADQAFEHAWFGRIALAHDHLPKVVEIGPRAVSIYGYSGRGISPGTTFGRAAARLALSGDWSAFPLAPAPASRELLSGLKARATEWGAALVHLTGDRFGV